METGVLGKWADSRNGTGKKKMMNIKHLVLEIRKCSKNDGGTSQDLRSLLEAASTDKI